MRQADGNRYGLALTIAFSLFLAVVFGAYFLFVVNAKGFRHSPKVGHDRADSAAATRAVPH